MFNLTEELDDFFFGGQFAGGANLWVSNLSPETKATDLKRLFSRHGKLLGAKIVTSARTPGARCYGYVTMANMDDADRCIRFLHRVELHGRLVYVEKVFNFFFVGSGFFLTFFVCY